MNIEQIHQYFKARIIELKSLALRGDPWIFLCCSSFIDYLVRATYNKQANAQDYKNFIRDYLSKIDLRYKDFEFESGQKDLPEQMYYILRCGIIHSFSLFPDEVAKRKGGRIRSIIIGHDKNGDVHLSPYIDASHDSAVLTAESFTIDLEKLVDYIFIDSITINPEIESNIKNWWTRFTPINAIKKE